MAQKYVQGLRSHAKGMIAVLVVQYLLGMATNLFVKFPDLGNEKQLWVFAWHQIPLALHIIVGLVLFVGTVALAIRAALLKERYWVISSGIALLSVFVAIWAGGLFISKQSDMYSFVMALGFIVALLSYGWGLYVTK